MYFTKNKMIVGLTAILLTVTSAAFGQTIDETRTLQPDQTMTREMTGAETHRYKFDLKAKEFFQVQIEQKTVNVTLKLYDSNSNELITSKNSKTLTLPDTTLSLSYIAATDGIYFLEVISPQSLNLSNNSYKIKRESSRIATEEEMKNIADILSEKGSDFYANNLFRQAIIQYLNALLLYESINDNTYPIVGRLVCNRTLGAIYFELKDNAVAIKYLENTLDLLEKFKKQIPNADLKVPQTILFNDLAKAYFAEGREETALSYLKRVNFENLDYWNDKKEKYILKESLDLLSDLYVSLGDVEDYETSIQNFNRLIDYFNNQPVDDFKYDADISPNVLKGVYMSGLYSSLAKSYTEAGYYFNGINSNKKGLDINLTIQQKLELVKNEKAKILIEIAVASESNFRNNIGIDFLRSGNFAEAEKYIQDALNIAIKQSDSLAIVKWKSNLAAVYARQKKFGAALNGFDETLPKLKTLRDEYATKFRESKDISNRLQERNLDSFVGVDLYYYGTILRETGKLQEAINYHIESIQSLNNSKFRKFEARARVELGLDYLAQNKIDIAEEEFAKAYQLSTSIQARDEQIVSLDGLMRAWQYRDKNLAIIYGKQSVNLLQTAHLELKGLGENFASEFLKDNENTYRRLADLLVSDGRLREAETVLNLLKDEEFSSLSERNEKASQNIPYLTAENSTLKILERVAALGREKSVLDGKNKKGSLTKSERARFSELDKQISTTEAEFDNSLKVLSDKRNKGENFDDVLKNSQPFMNDLGALGSGTVALYTVIVSDEKLSSEASGQKKEQIKTGWIILVTPEFRKAYPIDVANLEQTVLAFRTALSSLRYDPQSLAQELYKKLFLQTSEKQKTTLAADLDEYFKGKPNKTLMWSLDGVLRYVPMAALHDGKTYLVEKYRNTVFNTASKARLKDVPKKNWTVLGLGVSVGREESGKTFPALDGAKRELLTIVRQKNNQGILPGTIKLNDNFTSSTMYDGLQFDKNPVVHIASHFSYNPMDFEESFLLLGKGKLTLREIAPKSNLFLYADLVTLSACETAVGDANGKDIEGFAYRVQDLGAKAVMATLWQVDDIGTQVLMPEFYRLHESGIGKGEALRQAQLALLQGKIKDAPSDLKRAEIVNGSDNNQFKLLPYKKEGKPPFAHPFYWSPFVLIGNWK